MKVLIWGTRNATPKWLEVLRLSVQHASLIQPPPLADWLKAEEVTRVLARSRGDVVTMGPDWPLTFIHGDGPPGESKEGQRCPLGVDRLSEVAVVLEAPRHARMKRFPVAQGPGETWGYAAARRDREMVAASPDRGYCFHTDVESSRGSRITAEAMREAGRPYWYVRMSAAGKVLEVQERR